MGDFMRASDAFSWYMERDPVLRATVVAIAWLERSPDWESLRARLDRATCRVPMFRQRVLQPPARIATPRWSVDDAFDIDWHLRRINSPAPHSPQTVVAFARCEAMSSFDQARPLWKFTLIEDLEGDRAALVMKLHHSLTDGLGGMELALLLFDADEQGPGPVPAGVPPAPEGLGFGRLLGESLALRWRQIAGRFSAGARSALPTALCTARHPIARAFRTAETSASIYRGVAPVLNTLSPIMTRRGLRRDLDAIEFRLEDLKRAASVAGGTVNDGFMAAITGGLRLYHEIHGLAVDTLRVTLPISIRRPGDPIGGNRITLSRFVVPISQRDVAERVREIHELCQIARHEPALPFTNSIAATLNLLPPAVVGGMLKHVDFLTSDVPGFDFPVYLSGVRVERYSAFGPTIGTSLNLTLLSYNGTGCVGITMDRSAVGDPGAMVECLRQGIEEVLALGGEHLPGCLPFSSLPFGSLASGNSPFGSGAVREPQLGSAPATV